MVLARQAELTNKPAYIPLLDELDRVITSLLRQKKAFYNRHWVMYYKLGVGQSHDWNDTWPALAVEYGLATYLDFRFPAIWRESMGEKRAALTRYCCQSGPTEATISNFPAHSSCSSRARGETERSLQLRNAVAECVGICIIHSELEVGINLLWD